MFGGKFKDNVIGIVLIVIGCIFVTIIAVIIGRVRENKQQNFSIEVGSTECEQGVFLADSTGALAVNTTIERGDPVWYINSTNYTSKLVDPPQGLSHQFTATFDTIRYVDKDGIETQPRKTVLNADICFSAASTMEPGSYSVSLEMSFNNPKDTFFPPTVLIKTFEIDIKPAN